MLAEAGQWEAEPLVLDTIPPSSTVQDNQVRPD